MKNLKFLMLLAVVLTLSFNVKADNDQVITFDQLPASAQALHKQYFGDKVPLVVTMDWDDYTSSIRVVRKWNLTSKVSGKMLIAAFRQCPQHSFLSKSKLTSRLPFPALPLLT